MFHHRPFSNSHGSPKNRGKSKSFDPSLFVKKATSELKVVEYTPKNSFTDFNLCPQLQQNIAVRGYPTPTPIQDQAIPALISGQDVIWCSQHRYWQNRCLFTAFNK
jgi:hypothetical protein